MINLTITKIFFFLNLLSGTGIGMLKTSTIRNCVEIKQNDKGNSVTIRKCMPKQFPWLLSIIFVMTKQFLASINK